MTTEQIHYWRGEWLDDQALESKLECFRTEVGDLLQTNKLDVGQLLHTCQVISVKLLSKGQLYADLKRELVGFGKYKEAEIEASLEGIGEFLKTENLQKKLNRELGSFTPFCSSRINFKEAVFERWAPLGLLVHVAPTNSLSVGVLSVVEGLLSGNINFLKTSSKDCLFAQKLLAALVNEDETVNLRDFIFVARMSSKESKLLKEVFSQADGVAVWGGEESVNAVKKITPSGARFIDWGPKISFGYVADSHAQCLSTIEKFALDICLVDQQACSSPQCIYLETDSKDELDGFASNLAHALAKLSSTTSGLVPSLQEQAEITNVTELVRLGSCLNEGNVIETEDRAWRVLIEYKPGLRASPLFRSIWVKPLPRNQIVRTLRPLRQYLQTVGIAGEITDIAELSRDFVAAGVQRVTLPGHMHDSYMGEPHDGRYALQAYTRRVSWQLDQRFEGISCLEDFIEGPERKGTNDPLMTKEDFQAQVVDETFAHLFFKSGGSSGDPKISLFTYDDYHGQMFAAAEGLYAAGLNPATDRCMNLFFGGGLYGGFISFFTILERLGAVQLPMSSHLDFDFVAEMIVRNKVNVLLGMPSYLIQIFQKNESILKEYAGVKKIFFGGEHFNGIQRRYLKDQFGVELVKSATYGSVDAGPLGFQCQHCDGTVHHVHDRLQYVEIVSLASDEPVGTGEVGRLIFTSKMRSGQKLNRYEIGDLGRWVQGPCKCGRTSPRFELLGRHGDIVRVGSAFINYRKINQVIADTYLYAGEMQMILDNIEGKDHILIKVGTIDMQSPGSVLDSIISDYADLREIVSEGLLTMDVKFCDSSQFERTSSSGKLRLIIDKRVPQ